VNKEGFTIFELGWFWGDPIFWVLLRIFEAFLVRCLLGFGAVVLERILEVGLCVLEYILVFV